MVARRPPGITVADLPSMLMLVIAAVLFVRGDRGASAGDRGSVRRPTADRVAADGDRLASTMRKRPWSPDFRLDDQAALVTGAASGIGRGIAVGLAEAGADVACVDLPGPGAERGCRRDPAAGASGAGPARRRHRGHRPGCGRTPNRGRAGSADPGGEQRRRSTPLRPSRWTGPVAAGDRREPDRVFLSCQAEARVMLARGGARSSTSLRCLGRSSTAA